MGPGGKDTALYKTKLMGEADSQQINQEMCKIPQPQVQWRIKSRVTGRGTGGWDGDQGGPRVRSVRRGT